MLNTNPNIRRSKESQEAYRKRLREMHAGAKGARTRMLWPSSSLGTYHRLSHGPLNENAAARFWTGAQRVVQHFSR